MTNDVLLQQQEAINNERNADNRAVHFSVAEEIVAQKKAATVLTLSDV